MRADDKKIKKAFQELKVPVSYEEKVDSLLDSLREQAGQEETVGEKAGKPKSNARAKYVFRAAVCLLGICAMLSVMAFHSNAGFLEDFKRSLMDFLGFETRQEAENAGVGNRPVSIESKRDMLVVLEETVIDSHNIYLLVKLIAPGDVVFAENVGFDYFCFCKGENFDVNHMLSGSCDWRLLETQEGRANEARYVISVNFVEEVEEDSTVTCFLQDLTEDPYGDAPRLLVEGIWSLTFSFAKTVADSVVIEGDLSFPYVDDSASVERVELSPTGMVVSLDVSGVTYDLLGVSDLNFEVELAMWDGSRKTIACRDPEKGFVQSASFFIDQDGNRTIVQYTCEFQEVLAIEEVMGVYIENRYLPVR